MSKNVYAQSSCHSGEITPPPPAADRREEKFMALLSDSFSSCLHRHCRRRERVGILRVN